MSSHSPQHHTFGLTDSPISSLSPSSPPSFSEDFISTSMKDHTYATVYDVLYSTKNPSEFYNGEKNLVTAGCPHLNRLKKLRSREHSDADIAPLRSDSNSSDQWNLFTSYRSLVRYSLTWYKHQQSLSVCHNSKKRKRSQQLPLPQCDVCLDPLSQLHVCLHCVYMAMDFAHRTIYCSDCGDYIYDAELNDIILQQETILSETAKSKTPHTANASWEPTKEEVADVVNNSSLMSCQGIRGLCNMGNTCFMNVILQSFLHNPLLKAYFLSDQHSPSRCKTKYCLCCEMDTLFSKFYSGAKEPYGPCSFLHSMWMSVKELAGYAQQDAHEFFISALNNIHAGCEGHSMSNCTCIVHKTFAGLLQSNVTCLRCSNVTTTFDPMLDISLGLRPAEKRKKGTPLPSGGSVPQSQGKSGGLHGKRMNTLISLADILTQRNWVLTIIVVANVEIRSSVADKTNLYTLFAVINHHGKIDSGHYTMYAKHRNQWFKFEDHNVTTSLQKEVLESKA
ncbi:hypothetical protein BX666DRAFT_1866253 [Dichotomocladium elegans]|nr:hypothetical protein BX666DRAFT_1866253 [Dichotomocladium elegans]